MKKIFYSIISAAAILTACNQEVIVPQGQGSLALDLSCKTDYTEVETKALTDEEIINGLSIDIVRPFDGWKVNYTPFSTIRGKVVELGSGSYVLTASSPEKEDAAFDQPIFEGSKDFDIKVGEVTSIGLECTISNLKVDLKLSENFVTELSDYDVTVSNGKGSLIWSKNSTTDDFVPADDNGKTVYMGKKSGYFTVAPLTITVTGRRSVDPALTAKTIYKISDVASANNHIICLDAQVIGSLQGITITVSDEVNPIEQPVVVPGFEEEPVEGDKPNEGGDDNTGGDNTGDNTGDDNQGTVTPPAPSTAPTLVWESNPTFADLELPMTTSAVVDVELTIEAPAGIAEFIIYVESGVLSPTIAAMSKEGKPVDGIATMDMIYDDVLYTSLGEGLPMKDRVLNQTSVEFSLSSLVPLINMYVADIKSGDKHIFSLYVKDNNGDVLEKTITFVSVPAV